MDLDLQITWKHPVIEINLNQNVNMSICKSPHFPVNALLSLMIAIMLHKYLMTADLI